MASANDNISLGGSSSNDEQLELALEEAARLAVQIRCTNVSSMTAEEDELVPEQPFFLIHSDLSVIEPEGIPTDVDIPCFRSLEGEFETVFTGDYATDSPSERSASRGDVTSEDEIAAAIRTAEAMAQALQSYGLVPSNDVDEEDTIYFLPDATIPLAEEDHTQDVTSPKESASTMTATPDKVNDLVPVKDYTSTRPATTPAAELRDYTSTRPATTPAAELRDYTATRPATTPATELRDYSSTRPATTSAAEFRDYTATRPATTPAAEFRDYTATRPATTPAAELRDYSTSSAIRTDTESKETPINETSARYSVAEATGILIEETSVCPTPEPEKLLSEAKTPTTKPNPMDIIDNKFPAPAPNMAPSTLSFAEAGAGASAWQFYSAGLSSLEKSNENRENGAVIPPSPFSSTAATETSTPLSPEPVVPDGVADPSTSEVETPIISLSKSVTPTIVEPSPVETTKQSLVDGTLTPVGETLARGHKSRELREKLRQTEAQYEKLKLSRSVSSASLGDRSRMSDDQSTKPIWLRLATLKGAASTPVGKDDLTWDKIDHARHGDEDFMPMRDYSLPITAPAVVPVVDPEPSPVPIGSDKLASKIHWTKIEEPREGDEDFVPLGGFGEELLASPISNTHFTPIKSETSGKRKGKDSNSREMHDLGRVMHPMKLRTPAVVKWERVDFVERTDDDYVPLKDYSKVPACTAATVSSTPRSLSPISLDDNENYDDEYEMIISAFQSKTFDSEGPTAFELARRKQRRRLKTTRIIAISVCAFVIGVGYFFYTQRNPSTPPLTSSVKRANYKTKYRPSVLKRTTAAEQPTAPKRSSGGGGKAPTRSETAGWAPTAPEAASVHDDDDDDEGVGPEDIMEEEELRREESLQRSKTALYEPGEWQQQQQQPPYGAVDLYVELDNEAAVNPQAKVCLLPFGYLLAEQCSEVKRPKRLEKFIHDIFQ